MIFEVEAMLAFAAREQADSSAKHDPNHRQREVINQAGGEDYWQTTVRGLFALPNATALSVSSAGLYVTGIAEQSYKRIEALTGRIGGEISHELGEVARRATLPEPERAKRQPSA